MSSTLAGLRDESAVISTGGVPTSERSAPGYETIPLQLCHLEVGIRVADVYDDYVIMLF